MMSTPADSKKLVVKIYVFLKASQNFKKALKR